jgi:hypothetical protein
MRKSYGQITNLSEEFWYHVSQQHELPLATNQVTTQEIAALNTLADSVRTISASALNEQLAGNLLADPDLISLLRTLIRISDKRLYLDLSYEFSRLPHPTQEGITLCGCAPQHLTRHSLPFFINLIKRHQHSNQERRAVAQASAQAIARYFLEKGLANMLHFYASLDSNSRALLVRHLILPGEIQQAEAKLRGHGIEQALAILLRAIGCQFFPEGKDTNPMGSHDPNIDPETMQVSDRTPGRTFSTDLVILDRYLQPTAFVVGLVHTSDPGQFGVDKSDTVVAIRRQIDVFNSTSTTSRRSLWGLVDGVGYSENKAGTIDKIAPALHCMLQNHSLYKAALEAHRLGLIQVVAIAFDDNFYSMSAKAYMQVNYVPAGVQVIDWNSGTPLGTRAIDAGRARVYVPA